jgi:NAD(P)-dependent dehydrogenase (short-subunit alcohol dehydrogenase family)
MNQDLNGKVALITGANSGIESQLVLEIVEYEIVVPLNRDAKGAKKQTDER